MAKVKATKKEQLALLKKLKAVLPVTPAITTALQTLEEEIKKPPPVPPGY
jgi:hypothetical protein